MRSSPKAPGIPSSIARSLVPISSESMPGTAAIAAAFSIAVGVSSMTMTRVAALIAVQVSASPSLGIAEMRQAAGHRAVALWWIAQCLGDLSRLFRRVDMRHDDAERTAVEDACCHPQLAGRYPDHRRDPGADRC